MANKYFVWKDPNCNGENIEWIEMDNIQFSEFIVLPENKFRRFIRLGNQICHEADVIVLETTEVEYLRWDKERRRSRYLRENSDGFTSVSLDAPIPGNDELMLSDAIPDENDIEETVIHQMMLDRLAEVMTYLKDDEKDVLMRLYAENISLNQLAQEMGIPRKTLEYRREKILGKLKKFFASF